MVAAPGQGRVDFPSTVVRRPGANGWAAERGRVGPAFCDARLVTPFDWRAWFEADDGLVLRVPAVEADLAAAEEALDAELPDALRQLYRVSDGVFDGPGQWFVVWPLGDVVERNRDDWAGWPGEFAARRDLVAFGDDGTGTPFCTPRDGGPGVFVWSPIEAVSIPVAGTVDEFFTRWRADSLPLY